MKNVFAPFTWIAVSIFFMVSCDYGDAANLKQKIDRIVGGEPVEGIPAVGALTYYGHISCTATLIGPRSVLTAAHCVEGVESFYLKFLIGPDIDHPQYKLKVEEVKIHPNYLYTDEVMENDIALVILQADAPVEPLEVLNHMDASWEGTRFFFVGYGLQNGFYPYKGFGTKRGVWLNISQIESDTFLSGDNVYNTCNGDSGGPALFQKSNGTFQVAGITSCSEYAHCDGPGVSFRVDPYLDFLQVLKQCNGQTSQGRCDGNKLIYCDNGNLIQKDCAAEGQVCSFDNQTNISRCKQPEETNPCKGETSEGRCSNGWLFWCGVDYQIFSENCTAIGKTCKMGYLGYYECR